MVLASGWILRGARHEKSTAIGPDRVRPDRARARGRSGVAAMTYLYRDATGHLWRTQQLKGKLAAGFIVSSLPSGDKQSTLLSMFVFSMQHGMLWVGNPIMPEQHRGVPYDEAANRLGSWSGLMAQAGHSAPADSFVPGDVKTARMFGRHFAQSLDRVMAPV